MSIKQAASPLTIEAIASQSESRAGNRLQPADIFAGVGGGA